MAGGVVVEREAEVEVKVPGTDYTISSTGISVR